MISQRLRKQTEVGLGNDGRAFTLVELLAVIVIVAVLAGLLVAVIGAARRSAANAQCISAMRQIGLGTQLYLNDNKSRRLPGPVFIHILPKIRANNGVPNNYHLFSFISSYLSRDAVSTNRFILDEHICEGWRRDVPVDWKTVDVPVYMLNNSVMLSDDGILRNPWGAPNNPNSQTSRYSEIVAPETTWMLSDLDAINTNNGAPQNLPPSPVHGNHRNRLYFDWHVGSVPTAGSQ